MRCIISFTSSKCTDSALITFVISLIDEITLKFLIAVNSM